MEEKKREHHTYIVSKGMGGSAFQFMFEFDRDRLPATWFSYDLYNYVLDNPEIVDLAITMEDGNNIIIKRKDRQ